MILRHVSARPLEEQKNTKIKPFNSLLTNIFTWKEHLQCPFPGNCGIFLFFGGGRKEEGNTWNLFAGQIENQPVGM